MVEQPPYSCILDGVQFVQINASIADGSIAPGSVRESMESQDLVKKGAPTVMLKFHYTRRMADILREEAFKERRIQMERDAIKQAEE